MSPPENRKPAARDRATGSGDFSSSSKIIHNSEGNQRDCQQKRIQLLEMRRDQLVNENATLKARTKHLGDMFDEWQRGGFSEVIRGKDEVIRVLRTRVDREVADAASWRRSAEFFRRMAVQR